MGFLDTIGQRASQSPAPVSRASVNQNPTDQNPTNNEASSRFVQRVPTWDPAPHDDRIHPAAIWCAALFVVGAVAAAGWLAKLNGSTVDAAPAEAAAEAPPQKENPVARVSAKPTSVRPRTAVRRGNGVNKSNRNETASEAPVPDITRDPLAETEVAPGSEAGLPSIVALPEDDTVYSSEGNGVVAPRLASLGFVRRLVNGLRVETATIELVISKSGTVERAKIYSTPHWEDALLLSRAKTFQFVPAYRNGHPVRYRYVMDVDTSP